MRIEASSLQGNHFASRSYWILEEIPASFRCDHVGHSISLDASSRFVDAQGSPLGVSDKLVAELVLGDLELLPEQAHLRVRIFWQTVSPFHVTSVSSLPAFLGVVWFCLGVVFLFVSLCKQRC